MLREILEQVQNESRDFINIELDYEYDSDSIDDAISSLGSIDNPGGVFLFNKKGYYYSLEFENIIFDGDSLTFYGPTLVGEDMETVKSKDFKKTIGIDIKEIEKIIKKSIYQDSFGITFNSIERKVK